MSGARGLTAFLVLALVAVAVSVLIGEDGIPQLLRLRAERQQLGERVVALAEGNRALHEEIARFNGDDRYLEALARRELGLVRPNELVFRFRRPPKTH